jgi:hypothetical protein
MRLFCVGVSRLSLACAFARPESEQNSSRLQTDVPLPGLLVALAIAPLQVLRFTTTCPKSVLAGQLGRFGSSLRGTFQTCFPRSMSREMATNSVRRMPLCTPSVKGQTS